MPRFFCITLFILGIGYTTEVHASLQSFQDTMICVNNTAMPTMKITGTVLDTVNNELMEFGTVALYDGKVPLGGVMIDSTGRFELNIPGQHERSKLEIRINYVGYLTKIFKDIDPQCEYFVCAYLQKVPMQFEEWNFRPKYPTLVSESAMDVMPTLHHDAKGTMYYNIDGVQYIVH